MIQPTSSLETIPKTSPLSRGLQRIIQSHVKEWTPVDKPPSAEWCSEQLRLCADVEATAGKYNTDERPYWKTVLEAFDDPDVESIVVQKSTQVGGTVTLWAAMLYKAMFDPAPCMVVLPDRESAVEFRDRVYMNALETPATRHLVPKKRDWNTRYIDLRTMRVYLAWSGSAQKLRMRACQTVYLSEVDVFGTTAGHRGGDPNKAAAERTKSFYDRKLYRESSPTAEPSTIAAEYENSNEGKWHCPCPKCGRYQELRFFPYKVGDLAGKGGIVGYLDRHGNLKEPEDAEASATYCCLNGCTLRDHEVNAMVRRGVYCPKGQSVDDDGKLKGEPDRGRRNFGLHLWSIHSPTITMGQIASEYVSQKRLGNISDFMTNWVGIAFESRRKVPTWRALGTKLAAQYSRGQVWTNAWFLTGGCDVQADRVKWSLHAWGDRCTHWLVDWGEYFRTEEYEDGLLKSDLLQLTDGVINRAFPICDGQNPFGKTSLYASKFGIDANHRTTDVHHYIKHVADPRVIAIRGDHQVSPAEKYRKRTVERNVRTGEPYPGGMELHGIYVNVFKSDLIEKFSMLSGQAGAFHVPEDAVDVGKSYLQEVVNEPPQVKVNKHGRRELVYIPKSGTIPVDWWDTTVYARGIAEMVVDGFPGRPGWDATKWPKPEKQSTSGRSRRPATGPDVAARDYSGVSSR